MANDPDRVNASYARLEFTGPGEDLLEPVIHGRLEAWFGTLVAGALDSATAQAFFVQPGAAVNFAWRLRGHTSPLALNPVNGATIGIGLYIYEDNTDGDGGNSQNHAIYQSLHAEVRRDFPSETVGGTYQAIVNGTGNFTLPKGGSYRAQLVIFRTDEAPVANPRRSQVTVFSEYYLDSDRYVAFNDGTALEADAPINAFEGAVQTVGWLRVGVAAQSLSTAGTFATSSTQQGYTDAPTLSGDVAATELVNPKQVRVGVSLAIGSASAPPVKEFAVTPAAATGAFGPTAAYAVDTLFPQAAGSHRIRLHVGASGGQIATPTAEQPSVATQAGIVLNVPTVSDKAWTFLGPPAAGLASVGGSVYAVESTTNRSIGYDVTVRSVTRNATADVPAATTLYNRGWLVSIDYRFDNAYTTEIDPDATVLRVHAAAADHTVEATMASDSAAPYNVGYTTGSGHVATADLVGTPKHVHATFAHYGANDPAIDYTGTTLLNLSRLLRVPGYVDADTDSANYWHGKGDAATDGAPTGPESATFFVGADSMFCKIRVIDVLDRAYDDAAVAGTLLRGATIEQNRTGAQTQTESLFDGWMDVFYEFQVNAPAGARVLRLNASLDGNTTGDLDANLTWLPSYTGNLGFEATSQVIVAGSTARIVVIPQILDQANLPQLISEAGANLEYSPRLWVRKRTASGVPPRIAGSPFTMTAINPPGATEDDAWEITLTGLTAGDYVASVVFQMNGGQVPPRADFPFTVTAPLLLSVSIEPTQNPRKDFTVQVRATIDGAGVAGDANPTARIFYDRQKLLDPVFDAITLLPAAGDTGTYRESFSPVAIGTGAFQNVVDLYEVEVTFVYGGATYRAWATGSTSSILTPQEYQILARGGNADGLHRHTAASLGGGTVVEAPVVQAGEPVSAAAWEAALFDPEVTDQALAELVAENIAPKFLPQKSLTVTDARDPSTFKPGDTYVLDNGGRGQDGTYLIARVESEARGGGAVSKLTLNVVRAGLTEDLETAERGVGILQRRA